MEPKEIFLQPDDIQSELFDFDQYRIGYYIQKNLEKSSENEDSLFFYGDKNGIGLGVSDGVGGHPRGKDASRIASEGVMNYIKNEKFQSLQYLDNLEKVNMEIRDLKVGAKTTLTSAIIKDEEVRFYSIGDSEVLFCNTKGFLIYSNIPQSPVGYGVHGGYIDQEESLDDPERHLVNHLMGDEILRFEASSKIPFKKGHTLLLGSDGLFDNVEHQKLLDIVGGGSFEDAFDNLKQLCTNTEDWRKDDDISFFIVRRVRSE